MSNSKGNQYPLWGISISYQVFAVNTDGHATTMSNVSFAMSMAVSEDGTVWVLSTTPDPDGGGSKLFWSNGDGNWTEINTTDPGGVSIAGGEGDKCYYLTSDSEIRSMDTSGNSVSIYKGNYIADFDYGGGMFWALMPEQSGGAPYLQYTPASAISWKVFQGKPQPASISANYQGNCLAVTSADPVYYSKDGSSTNSAGAGVAGKAFIISAKNWTFLLSTDVNSEGNLLYEWQDIAGGTFLPMSVRGMKLAASYYRKS